MTTTTYTTSKGPVEVRDPQWNIFSTIDCEINHPEYGWIPFTASPDDDREYGRELFEQLSVGTVKPADAGALAEEQDRVARERRTTELKESDWTQLPDVPLETTDAWSLYRQALRDITEQPGYPSTIVWPQKP